MDAINKLNKNRNWDIPDPRTPIGELHLDYDIWDTLYSFVIDTYFPSVGRSTPAWETFSELFSGKNPRRTDDIFNEPTRIPSPLDTKIEFERYNKYCEKGKWPENMQIKEYDKFVNQLNPTVSALKKAYNQRIEMDSTYVEIKSESEWVDILSKES